MFSEETSVFSVECYFAMFSDIAKTGSGSSRALSELVEFIFLYLINQCWDPKWYLVLGIPFSRTLPKI